MISKKTKISLLILSILFIGIAIYLLFTFHGIPTIYTTTVENTSFEEVIMEKDSTSLNYKKQDSSALNDSTQHYRHHVHHHSNNRTQDLLKNNAELNKIRRDPIVRIKEIPRKSPVGKELNATDFKQNYTANTRIRFTEFFNTFKNNDYISGKEFSAIYRRDPTLNKIAKSTICSFIEKNISFITRKDNQLIIRTVKADGIHTKIKIPFVEDLRINIADQATIDIGKTFTSTEPEFLKSILMPIQLNNIDIIHNGDEFPKKGYISGNYYFIEYSKTKMAYKIR